MQRAANKQRSPVWCLLGRSAYSFILKKEAVRSSETFVNFYQTTRIHIPDDSIFLMLTLYSVWTREFYFMFPTSIQQRFLYSDSFADGKIRTSTHDFLTSYFQTYNANKLTPVRLTLGSFGLTTQNSEYKILDIFRMTKPSATALPAPSKWSLFQNVTQSELSHLISTWCCRFGIFIKCWRNCWCCLLTFWWLEL
jgi:hypothetical protein